MITRLLNNRDLTEKKTAILSFLADSYKTNFNLSDELIKSICDEKLSELNSYLDENKAYSIGVFDENRLIGFIWFYRYTYMGEVRMHINQIVVSKNYRGKGIAKRLITEVEKIANNSGIKILDLNVSEVNIDAIEMYEKIGYKTERRLMKKLL